MAPQECKLSLPECRYAGAQRCPWCGKDERRRQRQRPDKRASAKYRAGLRDPQVPHTIGVDGEGHDGRYFMIGAADDSGQRWSAWNAKGLGSAQCFDFLVALPQEAVKWGFAFGYDINMMLQDVPIAALHRLRNTTRLRWREYRIEWIPGKMFRIAKHVTVEVRGRDKQPLLKQTDKALGFCTVWDMYPWQQTSFVKWLTKNRICSAAEIEAIAAMKGQRPNFDPAMKDEIIRYCLDECRYLARGAASLHEMLIAQGVRLHRFYSPASVSKALMNAEGLANNLPPKTGMRLAAALQDIDLDTVFDGAYFGGRAETSVAGPVEGPLYQYDIRSAYPYAATRLPCWRHGCWVSNIGNAVEPWSMVYVSWKPLRGTKNMAWGPLPIRPSIGSLRWPTHGTGWYWGAEVLSVMHLANVQINRHIVWRQDCDHTPFAYLEKLYRQRAALKAAGDAREYVNKLALNATYGALAQHPPKNAPEEAKERRAPKWRNLAWAGLITATTRGMVGALLDSDSLMVATDCVIARRPLAVPCSTDLGDWEMNEWGGAFLIGPGVYFLRDKEGQWQIFKSRGYAHGSIGIEEVLQEWKAKGRDASIHIERTVFVGLGAALHRVNGLTGENSTQIWRKFVDMPATRKLTLVPRREWRNSEDAWNGESWAPSPALIKRYEQRDLAKLRLLQLMVFANDVLPAQRLKMAEQILQQVQYQSLFTEGAENG